MNRYIHPRTDGFRRHVDVRAGMPELMAARNTQARPADAGLERISVNLREML